jgi:hypothetical protein
MKQVMLKFLFGQQWFAVPMTENLARTTIKRWSNGELDETVLCDGENPTWGVSIDQVLGMHIVEVQEERVNLQMQQGMPVGPPPTIKRPGAFGPGNSGLG